MKYPVLKSLTLALLTAASASFVGCGNSSTPSPTGSKKVIGFSKMNASNPFFEVIADGMREEAAKHGYEVKVVSADGDVAKTKRPGE